MVQYGLKHHLCSNIPSSIHPLRDVLFDVPYEPVNAHLPEHECQQNIQIPFCVRNISQFPLPVLTGIGHERDESITDLVAYKKLKTPTAVAEFIISRTNEFEQQIDFLKDSFIENVQTFLADNKKYLANIP